MRPPPIHVAAIFFVVSTELLAQDGLFVEEDEEVYAQCYRRNTSDHGGTGAAEDDPQSDPSQGKAEVHGVANMTVETDDDELRRWRDRCGSAAAGPAEVPNAAER